MTTVAMMGVDLERDASAPLAWFVSAVAGAVGCLVGIVVNKASWSKAPEGTQARTSRGSLVSIGAVAASSAAMIAAGWSRVSGTPVHDADPLRIDAEWTLPALGLLGLLMVGSAVLTLELMPDRGVQRDRLVRGASAMVASAQIAGSAWVLVKIPDPTMSPSEWGSFLFPFVLSAVSLAAAGRWVRAGHNGTSSPFTRHDHGKEVFALRRP